MSKLSIAFGVLVFLGVIYFATITLKNTQAKRRRSGQSPKPPASPKDSVPHPVPAWLLQEIDKYQKASLSYAFFCLTLDEKFASKAKTELDKLGITIYAPPPLLLNEARKAKQCSIEKLNLFLQHIYLQKTGKHVSPAIAQQKLEDFYASDAQEHAIDICSKEQQ